MQTDDMKLAWQEMNRRLERQEQLITRQLQMTHMKKARNSLWPLYLGQVFQMLVGIGMILLAVAAWSPNIEVRHVLIAGIVMHAYGVAMVISGGVMLGKLCQLDYSAPVAEIQRRLADLRVTYIRTGMIVGLSWWVLWVPFVIVLVAALGVDVYARQPLMFNLGILIGVLGLAGTWLFYRWSQNPERVAMRERMDDCAAGGSLRKAKKIVDEMASFQREA